MNILKIVLVATLMVGCGDSETVMDRVKACTEQAYAWCSHANSGTGCWYSYMYSCSPNSNSGVVRQSLENNCLEDIEETKFGECTPKSYCLPTGVPKSCQYLWYDANTRN